MIKLTNKDNAKKIMDALSENEAYKTYLMAKEKNGYKNNRRINYIIKDIDEKILSAANNGEFYTEIKDNFNDTISVLSSQERKLLKKIYGDKGYKVKFKKTIIKDKLFRKIIYSLQINKYHAIIINWKYKED